MMTSLRFLDPEDSTRSIGLPVALVLAGKFGHSRALLIFGGMTYYGGVLWEFVRQTINDAIPRED
jgi:hypothetical protein